MLALLSLLFLALGIASLVDGNTVIGVLELVGFVAVVVMAVETLRRGV